MEAYRIIKIVNLLINNTNFQKNLLKCLLKREKLINRLKVCNWNDIASLLNAFYVPFNKSKCSAGLK